MPPSSPAGLSLPARIRQHFGIEQRALALYLGVSPALIKHIEAGRRRLTNALLLALEPLARYLPAAPEAAPDTVAAALALATPDVAALALRRRACQQQALRVEKELAALTQRARAAQHWSEALPALLPTPQATSADPDRAAWLTGWLGRQARPLPPEAATRWRLLRARQAALAAEIAALEAD
jgi:transcriptional regulator with XRE-family HTH domain